MTGERAGPLTVLGIETSCDETAAAVVRRGADGAPKILAETLLSQIEDHRPYEGVVPEIAARAHLDHLDGLIGRAMAAAGLRFGDLDGVAATAGPGLIGGVMVGATMGKAIAAAAGKPFLAINHLEGHALSARLTGTADFPFLLLLVSGGHCQLLLVGGVGQYRRLGTTVDDAVGEAFDKVAKLLGLGYPGGPAVEAAALRAENPERFVLPRPMRGRPGCDFSFSGLKTAVLNRLRAWKSTQRRPMPWTWRRRFRRRSPMSWPSAPATAWRWRGSMNRRCGVWWSPAGSPPTGVCGARSKTCAPRRRWTCSSRRNATARTMAP